MSQGKNASLSLKVVAINLAAGGSAGLSGHTGLTVGDGAGLVKLNVVYGESWICGSEIL